MTKLKLVAIGSSGAHCGDGRGRGAESGQGADACVVNDDHAVAQRQEATVGGANGRHAASRRLGQRSVGFPV